MLSIVKLIKWNAVIVKQLRPTLRYQKLCMSSTGAKSAIQTVCRPEDESVDQEKTEPSGWKHHVQASSEPLTVNKDSKIVTHKTAIKSYQTHYGNDELEPFSAVLNWRKEDSPVHLRLAKQDVAEQIAREIRLHRKEHVPLLEINPGIGLLSKELVANGERKIRLIEQECSFADHMLVRDSYLSFGSSNRRDYLNIQRSIFFTEMVRKTQLSLQIVQSHVAAAIGLFQRHQKR